jgi:D-3-phosphoglycerate dehydrogenase
MDAATVYVPQPVHERALALLARHAEVRLGFGSGAVHLDEVLPVAAGMLVRNDVIRAAHIARAPRLRVLARHGIGLDGIDVEAATAAGVLVCNTPEANAQSVAEHVFALLLAVARRLSAADAAVRTGAFGSRDELVGTELGGKRLGVIGMGRVGSQVARIGGHGFGMHVAGFDPGLGAATIRERGAEPVGDLHALLRDCDVVSVHTPLTPATRGLVGEKELACLPAHAVIVHTSRGGVVDEEALIAALRGGRIAGAGVDVFGTEPPADDCGYFALPNVVLSPHTAAHTAEAMERMAMGAAEAILAALRGERPHGLVNEEVVTSAAWCGGAMVDPSHTSQPT